MKKVFLNLLKQPITNSYLKKIEIISSNINDSYDKKLVKLLKKIKVQRKRVISYGASYKSATIFNYCNIGIDLIEYAIDTTKK